MTITSQLFVLASHFLYPEEREAVQGDLLEAGDTPWESLCGVVGLVVRREAALWTHWRPWLAAFGLALPSSFLLMGFSLTVSRAYQQLVSAPIHNATGLTLGPGWALFLCNVLLLAGWSWTGGFVVGAVSRRTMWVSAVLCFAPCAFCLERFRLESLSRMCLLLFIPAALWGARRGWQIARINRASALALALGVTALTVPLWTTGGAWIPNWALSWPAWYLVATARRA
ncbi:MAG: hypothetical protein WA510_21210 [Acidobacteriaceae bacterium]